MVLYRNLSLSCLLALGTSCGDSGSHSVGFVQNQTFTGKSLYFQNLSPVTLAFNRSDEDPDVIEAVNRVINLFEYDGLVEPQLTQDHSQVLSFVTGIGIEAGYDTFNGEGQPMVQSLPVRMAVRAREWDNRAKAFKPTTKIFTQQGITLDSAQEFTIVDAYDPNFVFTGLGMRLREGRFTKLEVQRKNLESLYSSGSSLSAANQIVLPAGWAVVGLIIAVDKASPTVPTRDPFVEDIILYTGHLVYQ